VVIILTTVMALIFGLDACYFEGFVFNWAFSEQTCIYSAVGIKYNMMWLWHRGIGDTSGKTMKLYICL
jgi:hypothetical protein